MDLGLYTEPWNSHTAHHAGTVLFHSHNRNLYRDQAYNEKQGRLEREASPCWHTETLCILAQVLVTMHWQEKNMFNGIWLYKVVYFLHIPNRQDFLSEAYQRKAQTFLDKHKRKMLKTKFSLQINVVKMFFIATPKIYKYNNIMFCLIDLELYFMSMHTELTSSTLTSEVEWMVIPCHRRWWVHPAATSTGHELLLSFPVGVAKLQGQASNTLPLRLELLYEMKVTASAPDILWWKTGAGPPAHQWTGKHMAHSAQLQKCSNFWVEKGFKSDPP